MTRWTDAHRSAAVELIAEWLPNSAERRRTRWEDLFGSDQAARLPDGPSRAAIAADIVTLLRQADSPVENALCPLKWVLPPPPAVPYLWRVLRQVYQDHVPDASLLKRILDLADPMRDLMAHPVGPDGRPPFDLYVSYDADDPESAVWTENLCAALADRLYEKGFKVAIVGSDPWCATEAGWYGAEPSGGVQRATPLPPPLCEAAAEYLIVSTRSYHEKPSCRAEYQALRASTERREREKERAVHPLRVPLLVVQADTVPDPWPTELNVTDRFDFTYWKGRLQDTASEEYQTRLDELVAALLRNLGNRWEIDTTGTGPQEVRGPVKLLVGYGPEDEDASSELSALLTLKSDDWKIRMTSQLSRGRFRLERLQTSLETCDAVLLIYEKMRSDWVVGNLEQLDEQLQANHPDKRMSILVLGVQNNDPKRGRKRSKAQIGFIPLFGAVDYDVHNVWRPPWADYAEVDLAPLQEFIEKVRRRA